MHVECPLHLSLYLSHLSPILCAHYTVSFCVFSVSFQNVSDVTEKFLHISFKWQSEGLWCAVSYTLSFNMLSRFNAFYLGVMGVSYVKLSAS